MSYRSKLSLLTCVFCLSLVLLPSAYAAKPVASPAPKNWTGTIMTALAVIGTIAGVAYSLGYRQGQKSFNGALDEALDDELDTEFDSIELDPQKYSDISKASSTSALEMTALEITVAGATHLAKIDIVAELIQDLQSPDPGKRRKAIWDLGQQGDSRAVLPMVDLMRDSDSSQRSLILAAVSEIGMKTLQPVNRALLLSLQDRSSEVRKNGIRDVTRIYDLVGQVSQLLQHAATDPDQEVQETAIWALTQLNQICPFSGIDDLHRLSSRLSFKELGMGKKIEG